jgi:anthranilate synthase/aminodeoxychorismate synthase-like glutamine amidotransferase
MIVVIDNYDSFTYNLVQYLEGLGARLKVFRNDKTSLAEIRSLRPQRILISPGPGNPDSSRISLDVIKEFYGKIPLLGVCLGHQAIGYVFGAKIVRAGQIMHGKTSDIYHAGKGIFKGLSNPFTATRYHSLVIKPDSLPANLMVTAWTKDRTIMGIQDKKEPIFGVQFHPESILTKEGKKLLSNFLKI